MNDNLKKAIDRFISLNSFNRSLLISGEWGIGKTHYLKTILIPNLKKLDFVPIYFSLNGISTIADLNKELVSSCIINSNKRDKGFEKLYRKARTAIDLIKGSDAFFSIFEISDFLKVEKAVFLVDDLERISDDINIADVLGFINSQLIEHKNSKVIFIGDETKNQLTNEGYKRIKEKYIGWTIIFQGNTNIVIDNLIDSIDCPPVVKSKLMSQKNLIKHFCEKYFLKNIRTIQFMLDVLVEIFGLMNSDFKSIESDVTYFILVISTELKKGNLAIFQNVYDLPFEINNQRNIINQRLGENKTLTPKEEAINIIAKEFLRYKGFIKKEGGSLFYFFIEPIYLFIKNGDFSNDRLLEDLTKFQKYKNSLDQKVVNKDVQNIYFFDDISEEELLNSLDEVLATRNSFDLEDFTKAIASISTLIKNDIIENLSKQDLINFIDEYFDSNHGKDLKAIDFSQYRGGRYLQIINLSFPKVKDHFSLVIGKRVNYEINNALSAKINEVSFDVSNESNYRDVIDRADFSIIEMKIKSGISDRSFVKKFTETMKDFYNIQNANEFYSSHKEKLQSFNSIIESFLVTGEFDKIDKYFLNLLSQTIKEILLKLSQ